MAGVPAARFLLAIPGSDDVATRWHFGSRRACDETLNFGGGDGQNVAMGVLLRVRPLQTDCSYDISAITLDANKR